MSLAPIQLLPPIMTTSEVAELLRCSADTVERYVHGHELTAIQIGRERRFRAEDVLEFVALRPATTRGAK
ncbi:MAG: helix-turn-helix domain-containing protein [Phycisphaerales bacterium]|nr:MAG: helix-turn-helix domain-containing protein [Phycisphaerales bacterium]